MKTLTLKHGLRGGTARARKPPEFKAWESMVERCTCATNKAWKWYGGRGISVAAEWLHDPVAFIAYMGPRPSPKHSLDRYPNGNGNYEPGNVRWATPKQQARNRSNNRLVNFGGRQMPLIEAAELSSIPYKTVKSRLGHGWSVEDALSRPMRVTQ